MKKKTYNPFKLWGSWIGAGVGLLISLYDLDFLMNVGGPEKPIWRYIISLYNPIDISSFSNTFGPYLLIIIISGLLGYTLNLLWRKFK